MAKRQHETVGTLHLAKGRLTVGIGMPGTIELSVDAHGFEAIQIRAEELGLVLSLLELARARAGGDAP